MNNNNNLPNIGAVATAKIDGLSIRYAQGGASNGTPISSYRTPYPEKFLRFSSLSSASCH